MMAAKDHLRSKNDGRSTDFQSNQSEELSPIYPLRELENTITPVRVFALLGFGESDRVTEPKTQGLSSVDEPPLMFAEWARLAAAGEAREGCCGV